MRVGAVWGKNNNKIKFVGEITVFCYPQTVEKAQFPQQKPRKNEPLTYGKMK
jgi:hypothetical protein